MLKYDEMRTEAIYDIIEMLSDYDKEYCDLHHYVFNTDYYVYSDFDAEKVLNEFNIFTAIGMVYQYEMDFFGEVYTDLSDPMKLCNMLYYVIGNEIIQEMYDILVFSENWDETATEENNKLIISEMIEMFNISDKISA